MSPGTAPAPVEVRLEASDSLVRVVLDKPKGNVIDLAMIGELRAAIRTCVSRPRVVSILFEGRGAHFSFGASVEEHRGASVETLLPSFHALFREMIASGKVLLAAVRGSCLGGGLELAAFCHRVFAEPGAKLGCPEVRLGVFAPAASCILPSRVGQAAADDLLLTGRTIDATEAHALGLVDEIADDPASAAAVWHARHLAPQSATALAHAVRASRARFNRGFLEALDRVERQYLEELRFTADACEGISAFLEKRAPSWKRL